MPAIERLPANVLRSLSGMKPGKYGDGAGLWLFRRPDGGAQWVFRYTVHGRQNEMGLGSTVDVTLKQARDDARKWRAVARDGVNPKKARDAERAAKAKETPLFAEVMEAAFEARKAELKDDGRAGRWDSPLRVHILPKLGKMPIEDIDQRDIHRVLKPIWHSKPGAALKAINRIRIIFGHAAAMGLDVDMQAVTKAKALLGAQRHKATNIPAMDWREVPAFYEGLNGGTVAERALRLLILTGARSGEIRGCNISEIEGDTWIIPAERMKAGKEHRIPLSQEAQTVIAEALPFAVGGLLFPGRGGSAISDMTMTALMRRRGLAARPHGFRSSFRTWCAEATDTPREIAETCLAHSTAGKVEAAYRRTDFLERRRVLMERWASHIAGLGSAAVVRLTENGGA